MDIISYYLIFLLCFIISCSVSLIFLFITSGKLLKDQAIPGMPRHSKGCPGIWPIPRQY